jgi:hypothetical protein
VHDHRQAQDHDVQEAADDQAEQHQGHQQQCRGLLQQQIWGHVVWESGG